MNFLKHIRYQNILIIAFAMILFRFGFLKQQTPFLALANWQYILLVFAVICIISGGFLINNIYTDNDKEDIIPNIISEKTANNIYVGLTITGVTIGFYLSHVVNQTGFPGLFIFIAGILYLYATSLKHIMIIRNLINPLIFASCPIIIGLFDIYPATYPENQEQMRFLFLILLAYALFIFIIVFMSEIIRDLKDFEKYLSNGNQTLPYIMELKKTKKIVFAINLLFIGAILYYGNMYLIKNDLFYSAFYTMFFIIAPLIYCNIKIWQAKTASEFNHLKIIFDVVLFFGIISVTTIC